MMPSRGWHLARGTAPRLFQAQCRNLSSATRRIPQGSNAPPLSAQRIPSWRLSTPIAVAALSSIRHASTAPNPPTATDAASLTAAASPEPSSTAFPNLETMTLDDIDFSTPADMPEKIGYLHEVGLNYGWGPTSMLQWAIEHIHIYGGVPWWAAVALTAVGLRFILLPLYIKSSDVMARQVALASVTKPITDRMTAAKSSGDTAAVQAAWLELMATRRRAGISFRHQFAPMILQGIFGYCGFKLIRAMAALPVPALKTDGFLWLQDMTLSDPYLILPIMMAGTLHFLVRMGGESGAAATDGMAPAMQSVMLWVLPGLVFVTMGFQSGLLSVWFAAGGALGVIQGQLLKQPIVRDFLNIAPLYKPPAGEGGANPMASLMGGSSETTGRGRARQGQSPTAWMSYQSPNLRRTASNNSAAAGKVIDVNPVNKRGTATNASDSSSAPGPDMVQPNAPAASSSKGIVGNFTEKFQEAREAASRFAKLRNRAPTEEQLAQKRKEAFKRTAREHEKRYKEMRKGR